MNLYIKIVKPIMDFIIALVALIILALPMIIISIIIISESKGSPIFVQKRIGKNGKRFNIFKFRTMCNTAPADTPTHLFDGSVSYITKVGNFLRKSSLDELPQLFNVITFNMAIAGPRPALWNQYDLEEARRENGSDKLRPGITGLAQIKGRDEISIERKAGLDGEYANNISFLYDIKIIFMTFGVVLKSKGVSEGKKANGHK